MARKRGLRANQGPGAFVCQGLGQPRRRRATEGQRTASCQLSVRRREEADRANQGEGPSRGHLPGAQGGRIMSQITRHQLDGYLDDALSDEEMAAVEKGLRESEALRRLLRVIVTERDRGEH